ncbi:PIR Superfamily Protein [Plasmodium ovale wallikeri]|uniref:PIR Superfamily Protein n=1 Tax=Plasmodium ovale wallikeri TaxID=864142 RepID=A0A1A9APM7_PLAOA|nr:PIR Superfamily Protein [Plasmodium ovale wallikeri]
MSDDVSVLSRTTYYDNIRTLTSVKNYDKLDNNDKTYGEYDKCYSKEKKVKEFDGFDDFCYKLTGNLVNFKRLPFKDLFPNSRCKYLNCWVYDRLLKENIKTTDTKFYDIIPTINKFFTDSYEQNECSYNFFSIPIEDFKKMKKLYDYGSNYSMIKYEVQDNQNKCSQEYYTYINRSVELYKSVKAECSTKNDLYCTVIDDIEKIHKNEDLSGLTCIPVSNPTELKRMGEDSLHDGRAQETESRRGPHQGYGESFSYDSRPEDAMGQEQGIGTDSPSSSNVTMGILFPFMGILLASFSLYKFTPLGSLLQNSIGRTQFIEHASEEQESLSYSYEDMDTNDYGNMHHIGYNTIQNS